MLIYVWVPLSILLAMPDRITAEHAVESAREVDAAAVAEDMERDANVAAVFLALESAGRAGAVGDQGAACSKMQLHAWLRRGHTCAELAQDSVLAVRLWLRGLRELRDVCGSTKKALGALASGRCGGAQKLVERRCELAGGCDG